MTYVDADLYFFDAPAPFFEEFDASGKDVLITEHAYAPHYDHTAESGRFCVQFMIFRRSPGARRVQAWWQEKCLEWCFARHEPGRFGDQMYLDVWPRQFAAEVHILSQTQRTLAPWNIDYVSREAPARPVFYHFQGFRILDRGTVKLYHGDRVAARNRWIYEEYLGQIRDAAEMLGRFGYELPVMPEHAQRFRRFKYLIMQLSGYLRFVSLDAGGDGQRRAAR